MPPAPVGRLSSSAVEARGVFNDQLKSLPVPTHEQTARFADHVADNHSWYKHLPFFPPGASFVFFPNPNAGRGVRADADRFVVYDVDRGEYFDHHSRLSTAEYLVQFGHWDYWVDDNPRVPDPQPGPWLYDLEGGRELLTHDLERQWSCRLTAFLKPAPPMFNLQASALRREADEFVAVSRRPLWLRLLDLFGGQRKEDPVLRRYREVAPALRQAAGTWGDASLHAFMESEARAQRELLLSTLHRVRAAWASVRGGSAEPSVAPDCGGIK
jgi:hypothetical protein